MVTILFWPVCFFNLISSNVYQKNMKIYVNLFSFIFYKLASYLYKIKCPRWDLTFKNSFKQKRNGNLFYKQFQRKFFTVNLQSHAWFNRMIDTHSVAISFLSVMKNIRFSRSLKLFYCCMRIYSQSNITDFFPFGDILTVLAACAVSVLYWPYGLLWSNTEYEATLSTFCVEINAMLCKW